MKSWPAASTIAARWRSTSATSRSRRRCSSSRSTATPTSSIRASTRRAAPRCRRCSGAEALRVEGGEQRRHQAIDGEGPAGGGGGGRGGRPVEVELALGRRVAVGDPGARVAHHQLLEQVAALGRVEQVGGERGVEGEAAHVDVEAGERPHERLGLVGGERPPADAGQRARARRARAASASSAPGTHTTSPVRAVAHEGEAVEVGAALRRRSTRRPRRAGASSPARAASTLAARGRRRRATSTSASSTSASAAAGPRSVSSASASRSKSVLNSRNSKRRRTSSTSIAALVPREVADAERSSGTSRTSTISSWFWRTLASLAPRFSRSFGVCSSRCSKMPSSPP